MRLTGTGFFLTLTDYGDNLFGTFRAVQLFVRQELYSIKTLKPFGRGFFMETAKKELKVALVGLGRVGSKFLKKLMDRGGRGIKVVAAAEKSEDALGYKLAKDNGITVYSDGMEIIKMGKDVDIIFDLTGERFAKMDLRAELARSGNTHTVIAPEVLSWFIWNIITGGAEFPTRA
jgi:glyceraldehyde-3-phosphate dehydrogenase/erythrose-4-phosphate dehydrogenase